LTSASPAAVLALDHLVLRVSPLTDLDAHLMLRDARGFALLEGYRGQPPADVAAIEEALLRVSRLVETVPEIAELNLNPVFVQAPGSGLSIAEARMRLAEPARG
jgi:hypothetical protein